MLLPLDKSGASIAVRATAFDENGGSFSPDGRSIAYQSDESGQMEVYVTATDGSGARVQLSNGGGRFARWVRNGTGDSLHGGEPHADERSGHRFWGGLPGRCAHAAVQD